jgi:hypothetical protein
VVKVQASPSEIFMRVEFGKEQTAPVPSFDVILIMFEHRDETEVSISVFRYIEMLKKFESNSDL